MAHAGLTSGVDWQEETYQKIKTLKEEFLPELIELNLKIAAKIQEIDSEPQHPQSCFLEKLNVFKMMLERVIAFLQLSKSNILPRHKENLGTYEEEIIKFVNTCRPRETKAVFSLRPGQKRVSAPRQIH